jgi:hypothetical protein
VAGDETTVMPTDDCLDNMPCESIPSPVYPLV